MITLSDYLEEFSSLFAQASSGLPWHITSRVSDLIAEALKRLPGDFRIDGDVAVHRTATIEAHAVVKGPVVIGANSFVASHAYLRGGVFIANNVTIGPGCEVKSSIILSNSALAHFNFVGDSIIGSHVNMEAGSVIANHFNERKEKSIRVLLDGRTSDTGVDKFGALIGDWARVGANAVLSPGTILAKHSVVGRLALIEQCPQ